MDRAQVSQLYRRYGPVIYGRCLSFLRNEAEARDALQEVFVRVLQHAEQFEERSRLTTWVYRIATNYCLTRLRDRRPSRELLPEDLPAARTPEQDATWRDLGRKLLARTEEGHLLVALHYFVDGMTQEEIAAVMGISRRTVGKRLARFRSDARALAAEGGSP